MKSINLIQFKNKIPLEKLNSTKTKKKKTKQLCKKIELKNNKMLEDEKNNLKKKKKKTKKSLSTL
jgi:hypothetical protein